MAKLKLTDFEERVWEQMLQREARGVPILAKTIGKELIASENRVERTMNALVMLGLVERLRQGSQKLYKAKENI